MLNVDGVIIGNTRTSAAGKDLNRQFTFANKDFYPEVYLFK
jgi:murein tripeptide amidase MpaA